MTEIKHNVFGSVGTPEIVAETQPQNDLQSLIELGCITDDIKLGNKVFTMRSLNANERLALAKSLGDEPTAEGLFDFNVQLLATSITMVDGKLLEAYAQRLESKSPEDIFKVKCQIISCFQSPVLGKLLDFYNELSKRCDEQFDLEQVKN